MKIFSALGLCGVAVILAGCGGMNVTETKVQCPGVDVILTESQVEAIKATTGEENFGKEICSVASKLDTSMFTEETKVTVTMPTGEAYDVKVQSTL